MTLPPSRWPGAYRNNGVAVPGVFRANVREDLEDIPRASLDDDGNLLSNFTRKYQNGTWAGSDEEEQVRAVRNCPDLDAGYMYKNSIVSPFRVQNVGYYRASIPYQDVKCWVSIRYEVELNAGTSAGNDGSNFRILSLNKRFNMPGCDSPVSRRNVDEAMVTCNAGADRVWRMTWTDLGYNVRLFPWQRAMDDNQFVGGCIIPLPPECPAIADDVVKVWDGGQRVSNGGQATLTANGRKVTLEWPQVAEPVIPSGMIVKRKWREYRIDGGTAAFPELAGPETSWPFMGVPSLAGGQTDGWGREDTSVQFFKSAVAADPTSPRVAPVKVTADAWMRYTWEEPVFGRTFTADGRPVFAVVRYEENPAEVTCGAQQTGELYVVKPRNAG